MMQKRMTTEEFIARSIEKHGDKFIYDKSICIGSKKDIIVKCKIHGYFLIKPFRHLRGAGCKKCVVVVQSPLFIQKTIDRTMTEEQFWTKVNQFHGNKYINDKIIFEKGNKKIIVECKEHGEFYPLARDYAKGTGCKICSDIKSGQKRSSTLEDFLLQAHEIHGDLYDYDKVIYRHSQKNVNIICRKHGVFSQYPTIHLQGHGCNKCATEINSEKLKLTTEEFILKATAIHGNRYIYDLANYSGTKCLINIICRKHGEFLQRATSHLQGKGCKYCSNNVSKTEIKWLSYLNVPEEKRHKFIKANDKWYSLDAFDEETNTIYEFHGDYWHGNPIKFKPEDINKNNKFTFGQLYKETIERENELRALGYNLVIIWENDWKKIEKELKKGYK